MNDPVNEFDFRELARDIEHASGRPLAQQIADSLRDRVRAGELTPGQPLPPQREFCRLLGVGEVTLRRAMTQLAQEGWVSAQTGRGTFVARPASRRGVGDDVRRGLQIGVVAVGQTDGYPFTDALMLAMEAVIAESMAPAQRAQLRPFFLPADHEHGPSLRAAVDFDQIDAFVFFSPVHLGLVSLCQAEQRPYVMLFNEIADGASRCIVFDYTAAFHEAIGHHVGQGRTRFALVAPEPDRYSARHLVNAFRAAGQAWQVAPDQMTVMTAGYHRRQAYDATGQLLRLDDPPQAVIYASLHQARGGLSYLADHAAGREQGWPRLVAVTEEEPADTSVEIIHQPVDELAGVLMSILSGPARQSPEPSWLTVLVCRYLGTPCG